MSRTSPAVFLTALLVSLPAILLGKNSSSGNLLHDTRQSATDLEIGGQLEGASPGATKFITYADLLKLPQATYTVSDDANFAGKTEISGVPLDELARLLGSAPDAKLVVAICYDGYRSNYTTAYLAAHRPLLVLKINGKTQENWPKSEHGGPLGPYLISHPAFTPSFKVLSHSDESQIPFGVTRIEFRTEKDVLGAIAPPGNYAHDSLVMNGYRIAQQNCYRCHNMGAEGGQMAARSWQILGMWAVSEPDYFARYVKNPQAIDAKSKMQANPEYDAATIDALRQYFATFAPASPGAAK